MGQRVIVGDPRGGRTPWGQALLTLPLSLEAAGPQRGVCIMVLMVYSMVFGFAKFLAHSEFFSQ